jgi:hypothetical protein
VVAELYQAIGVKERANEKKKRKKGLLRDNATDTSCRPGSGSRREGLQKDHMNKYAFFSAKREIM